MFLILDHKSESGAELEQALREQADETTFPYRVNWTGRRVSKETPDGKKVLNHFSRSNKLAQLIRLELMGISVPRFSLTHKHNWLGRTLFHEGGGDFRKRNFSPDFWSEFTPVVEEWRLHFFRTRKGNLRLLRSGLKVPKEGAGTNPIFRSHALGWRLSYIGGASEELVRVARAAISALQLDFGAVDIGVREDGTPLVFEVNTCPGLEGRTLLLYADSILERGKV